jgi:hypothetical protein
MKRQEALIALLGGEANSRAEPDVKSAEDSNHADESPSGVERSDRDIRRRL